MESKTNIFMWECFKQSQANVVKFLFLFGHFAEAGSACIDSKYPVYKLVYLPDVSETMQIATFMI